MKEAVEGSFLDFLIDLMQKGGVLLKRAVSAGHPDLEIEKAGLPAFAEQRFKRLIIG
ncbi:hypothetical protein D3C81_2341500 [compost metagenome]